MDREERRIFERGVERATATSTGEALDAALAELGWSDALIDDPRAAVSALFESQGSASATSSALGAVLADALGIPRGAGVVLPVIGACSPPGEVVDGHMRIAGLAPAGLRRLDAVVVVAGDGESATVLPADLEWRERPGLDPRLQLCEVTGARPHPPAPPSSPRPWDDAVAAGQRAIAHELVGASRAMLELARRHALERTQFDRPIAGFQAVRHRLADALVAIEGASATLDAAWDDRTPFTAALAKAVAGRAARTVARHSQQVLAGIGFTAEHPLHHYVRRVLVLDGLLGDTRSLTRTLGEELLRSRSLPAIVPL